MVTTSKEVDKVQIPDHDLTVSDIIRITGIGRNQAYRMRFWGEYRVGSGRKSTRRIRREEFVYRRNNGLNIAVDSVSVPHNYFTGAHYPPVREA